MLYIYLIFINFFKCIWHTQYFSFVHYNNPDQSEFSSSDHLFHSLVQSDLVWDAVGDEDGHHQPVYSDDSRHDHRNDGLHDQLRTHHGHGSDTRAALRRAIRRAQRCTQTHTTRLLVMHGFHYYCNETIIWLSNKSALKQGVNSYSYTLSPARKDAKCINNIALISLSQVIWCTSDDA